MRLVIIELLHRNRFIALAGATLAPIAANAWSIRIPLTPAVRRLVRDAERPESWDDAIFAVDGEELQPAVGTSADAGAVTVTVLR